MILPEKQESKSRYTITSVITMVLVFFVFSLLILANVPEAPENRDLVRELRAFNVVNLLPVVEEPEPEPEPEEIPEEEPLEEEPPPPPPPPSPSPVEEVIMEEVEVVERLDLGDLMPEGLKVDLSTEPRTSERAVAANPSPSTGNNAQQRLRLDESVMGEVGGLNALKDRKVGARSAAAGRRNAVAEEEKPSIEVETGVDAEFNTGIDAGRNLSETVQGRAAIADLMIAEMIDLGDFMKDEGAMNTVYASLSTWMGENPKAIPQSVNRIFTNGDQSSTFQTTSANFAVNERVFDLIIMNKTETNEIHVLLVEGTDATYLIDKNFSMQSNFLRRGSVKKQDGRIVEFGSSLRPANDQQTNEFYQIFLSWWNSVREDT